MRRILAFSLSLMVMLCGCSQNQVYKNEFFDEVEGMRTPNSFSKELVFDYIDDSRGICKYVFKLPKDIDEATSVYNDYIQEIQHTEGFVTDVIDDTVYVYKENELVSLMKAGTNNDGSLFLMITFQ